MKAGTRAQNSRKALVTGSLVFDTLFELANPISEQIVIKNGSIGKQNLMFSAEEKRVYFGGTAGNIAYGLDNLGTKLYLVSAVGSDFDAYARHLKSVNITPRIVIDHNGYSATFYGMSDSNSEQIGIFQGNAYHKHITKLLPTKLLRKSDWKDIDVGIFAAGNARSISRDLKDFRKHAHKGALSIFDPGQMLMVDFTENLIETSLSNASMLILNDVELTHLKNHFNFTLERIFSLGIKYVIETRGAEGSTLHEPNKRTDVKAVKVRKVVDPTGAGDAYRAGLIHGIISGKSVVESMRIGAKLGALCVAHQGAQTYRLK